MSTGGSARRAIALALGLFALYCVNGREIGAGDTVPALLQPIGVLRGDGFALDRFRDLWPGDLPYMLTERRGVLVSLYPLGPPALAVPFTAPQLWLLDVVEPNWEADPARTLLWARRMGKHASAAVGALTGVAIDRTLLALELGPYALPATLIATLGSTLWVVGSQSPWQHGPAAFALAAMMALMLPPPTRPWRLLVAGGACVLLIASRPSAAFLVALALLWVVPHYRWRAGWFLVLPLLVGPLLMAYNLWYFDSLFGGYSDIMRMVGPASHAVRGYWADDMGVGLLGTLVSPNRGLLVFCPWIPLSLIAWPAIAPALRRWPLVRVLLWGLPIQLLQLTLQSTWWAGWSFGPRYWTDVMPLFAVVLGFSLAWSHRRARALFWALLVGGGVAILIQAVGAFHYPSSYNSQPDNIDLHHERLWSWCDGELARELREGIRPWE